MKRRGFLAAIGVGGAAAIAGYRFWPDEGIRNPCLSPLPDRLARHELVRAAFDGIDPAKLWDVHAHLIGVGDGGTGVWVTPKMDSLAHPLQSAQKRFYLNAGCADDGSDIDAAYVRRLMALQDAFPRGMRLMLLAFDYHYDASGARREALSTFHTPNAYALALARRFPERFVATASVHPYRADAVDALTQAAAAGARAVKWLPPAMGMDPAAPRCDRFYEALARLGLPLLTHAGEELAVAGGDTQEWGNPLRLRRALDHGVTVIVAHCASLGAGVDLDQGAHGPLRSNFELFARLMDEPRYRGRLYGEISALTQVNRLGALKTVIARGDWHERLVNGSDYPLPGVMPIFSLERMVKYGYLAAREAPVLSELRRYNALLFDFVLKRRLRHDGKFLPPVVFESRRVFAAAARRADASTARGDA
jgi:uncharacterized protein